MATVISQTELEYRVLSRDPEASAQCASYLREDARVIEVSIAISMEVRKPFRVTPIILTALCSRHRGNVQ